MMDGSPVIHPGRKSRSPEERKPEVKTRNLILSSDEKLVDESPDQEWLALIRILRPLNLETRKTAAHPGGSIHRLLCGQISP